MIEELDLKLEATKYIVESLDIRLDSNNNMRKINALYIDSKICSNPKKYYSKFKELVSKYAKDKFKYLT